MGGQRCPACLQSSFITGLSSSSTTLSIAPTRQPTDERGGVGGLGGWGEGFMTARCLRKEAVPAVEQRLSFLRGRVLRTFIRGRGEGKVVVEDFGSRS